MSGGAGVGITGQWRKALRGWQMRTGRSAAAAMAGYATDCKAKERLGKKGQGESEPQKKQHTEEYTEGGSA